MGIVAFQEVQMDFLKVQMVVFLCSGEAPPHIPRYKSRSPEVQIEAFCTYSPRITRIERYKSMPRSLFLSEPICSAYVFNRCFANISIIVRHSTGRSSSFICLLHKDDAQDSEGRWETRPSAVRTSLALVANNSAPLFCACELHNV